MKFLIFFLLILAIYNSSLGGQPLTVNTSIIGGDRLLVEGNIIDYKKHTLIGQTYFPDFQVFDLKVSKIISGMEKESTIRIVHYFVPSEALPEGFLSIGSNRRFLLNKIIRPISICQIDSLSKESEPCYLLQSENATVLEDDKLLRFTKYFNKNEGLANVETNPSRIIKSNFSFREGKISPNGQYLLAKVGYDKVNLLSFSTQDNLLSKRSFEFVHAFNFSSDSKIAIIADTFGKITLWDTEKNKKVKSFKNNFSMAQSVAFSEKNYLLVIGDINGNLFLINSNTGKVLREIKAHQNTIATIAFSPNGEMFVTGSGDRTAKLWSKAGENVLSFTEHSGMIYSAVFSRNGKSVLTAGSDKIARLWSVENGSQEMVFQGHSGTINSLAFSFDGNNILTGSSDGTSRLWKTDGKQEYILDNNESPTSFVGFIPNTETILVGGIGGDISVWRIPRSLN